MRNIASIVGKSEDNVRQLASRARKHVDDRRRRFTTSREQQEELTQRFFAAAQEGDLGALEAVLAHDVVLTGDGGGKVPALARSLHGRRRVARTFPSGCLRGDVSHGNRRRAPRPRCPAPHRTRG